MINISEVYQFCMLILSSLSFKYYLIGCANKWYLLLFIVHLFSQEILKLSGNVSQKGMCKTVEVDISKLLSDIFWMISRNSY